MKPNKHIILFGFKNVGKTLIGKQLAVLLQKNFIDLDHEIEKHYEIQYDKSLTCRDIMKLHGELHYRTQEKTILHHVLQSTAAVIALGGGAVLDIHNRETIKSHFLLHVVAPQDIVFERIMLGGCPAFFDLDKDPYESFICLWEERSKIYKALSSCTIDNNASIDHAIHQAKNYYESHYPY